MVSDRSSFRKSPSIRLDFGHSESHGARSLFVEPCQICQGYARLHGLPYGLAWRRLNRASLTATLSVCHAALLQDLRDRNVLSAQTFSSSFRAPTTCSIRRNSLSRDYLRPLKLLFTRQPCSYSCCHRLRSRVLSATAITVIYHLSSCLLNFLLNHSLFVWKCKVSGTTFFTPRAAWSLPRFQLVRLASVSIATVQASIPQSGPRLRFGATPLVPCPFAFQPNLDSVRCVGDQTWRH